MRATWYFSILSTRGLSLILTQASAFNKTKISRWSVILISIACDYNTQRYFCYHYKARDNQIFRFLLGTATVYCYTRTEPDFAPNLIQCQEIVIVSRICGTLFGNHPLLCSFFCRKKISSVVHVLPTHEHFWFLSDHGGRDIVLLFRTLLSVTRTNLWIEI